MLLTGFFISTISALAWSLFDILRKNIGEKFTPSGALIGMTFFSLPMMLLLVSPSFFFTLPPTLHKLLVIKFPTSAYYWPFAMCSIFFNVVANYFFMRAIQISPLGLTIPYLAFTPVFSALLALFALNEVLSSLQWFGILVICLGAFFLNSNSTSKSLLAPFYALFHEKGILFMLVVAGCWSFNPVLDKKGLESCSIAFHLLFVNLGVGLSFLLFRIFQDKTISLVADELKKNGKIIAFACIFSIIGMFSQLLSYDFLPVAVTETLKRAIGMTSAVVIGYFFFKEGQVVRKLIASSIMLVGIALVLYK